MNDPAEVKNILKTLSGIVLKKPYYRSISIEYLNNLLSSIGSLQGGRYNLKNSFEVLYMAPGPETVIAECKKPYNFKIPPTVLITIEVNLQQILNLEDPQIIKISGIDTEKLLSRINQDRWGNPFSEFAIFVQSPVECDCHR